MLATRGQKRKQDKATHSTITLEPSNKRNKLTNPKPLHYLLKQNDMRTSYGWGQTSFYGKLGKLLSSDKLIKYEVDPTLKIARYKGKEFHFNYIEYGDYILSFDETKMNIKKKKDVDNLLEFASPDINDKDKEIDNKEKAETDNEEAETDNEDVETETDNESSILQHQNPIQFQFQHPQMYHQNHFQQQQNSYQHQFFIQTMIRTEITTTLIPWMKEYIDSELNKLKQ